jgi:hypothetical protein
MSKTIMPGDPNRADHRILMYIVNSFYGKNKYVLTPEVCDRMTRVFEKVGGSWERLFNGSTNDIVLLKKVVKMAIKMKIVEKAPKFR